MIRIVGMKSNLLVTIVFDENSDIEKQIDAESAVKNQIIKDLQHLVADKEIKHFAVADDEVIDKKLTQERKAGKWIVDDEEHGRIWHCHCSNCKKDPQDYIGGSENWWLVRLPEYCPNCGSQNKSAITKKQGSSIFIDRTIE